ncbi:discoidin domain-containing protein [Cohnella silvisoli]|uniref:Discoidin domain-containing protein n=1 Tax=Cohnella silvisoli TaxID=2873699 RepID=A0ABV1KS41_9BACL|nr:discoidin domain-containing protein [Cohnella silvisoli]MCD9022487.1 discoidin domain-containing protein [Cohnella silvisoli]
MRKMKNKAIMLFLIGMLLSGAALSSVGAANPANAVTALTVSQGADAANLQDRNIYTSYNSGKQPAANAVRDEWVTVDLGYTRYDINSIHLYPSEDGAGFPVRFKLQASLNGTDWSDIPGTDHTAEDYPNPGSRQAIFQFTDIQARYIRLLSTKQYTDSGGESYLRLAELTVTNDSAATSETGLQPVNIKASSEIAGLGKENVSNGNLHDFWSSDTSDEQPWLQYNFNKKYTISSVTLVPRSGGLGFPLHFKLEASPDGNQVWTTIADYSNEDYALPDSGVSMIEFPPVAAGAVRLTVTKRSADDHGNLYAQLAELQVHSEAPFASDLPGSFQKQWNDLWLTFGTVGDDRNAVAKFGNEASYFEWLTRKIIWTDDDVYRNELLQKVKNYPISASGLVWSWGDNPRWPSGKGLHLEGNPKYVLAAARIALWQGLDYLNQVDETSVSCNGCSAADGDMNTDVSKGKTVGEKMDLAMQYVLEGLSGKDGLAVIDNGENTGLTTGHPSNYWDNYKMGYKDPNLNIYFYASLLAMSEVKEAAGDSAQAAYYRDLAQTVKSKFNETFWDADKKRYISTVDVNGGKRDFGLVFVNIEALTYGLGDQAKAEAIYDWLDGRRTINGDTSQGADIYKYGFAPRSNTLAIESTGTPYWWNDVGGGIPVTTSGGWDQHLENGGAIFYTSYYDIMARAEYLGIDDAYRRMKAIADEYAVDDLWRDPANKYGSKWKLGVLEEFPESGLVPAAYLYAVLGIDASARGLEIVPRFPLGVTWSEVKGLVYQGRNYQIKVRQDRAELLTQADADGTFNGRIRMLPDTAYTVVVLNEQTGASTNLQAVSDGAGMVDIQGLPLPASASIVVLPSEQVVLQPAAPTNPVADDAANTLAFDPVPGLATPSQYEYSLNGGVTWKTVVSNPITGITGDVPRNAVQVRAKANRSTGTPSGGILTVDRAYTLNPPPAERLIAQSHYTVEALSQILPAGNAIDGRPDTFWSADATIDDGRQEWIQVKLDEPVTMDAVTLYPRTGGLGFPVRFRIDASMDGQAWTTVVDRTAEDYDNPGSDQRTFSFAPVKASYIKLTPLKQRAEFCEPSHCTYFVQLAEIELYKMDNNPPPAPSNPVVDDFFNTLSFTLVPGFPEIRQYEYTKDGGMTWHEANSIPIGGLDGVIAAGQVQVRVKADDSIDRPAGAALSANVPFTEDPYFLEPADIRVSSELLSKANAVNGNRYGDFFSTNFLANAGQTSWLELEFDEVYPVSTVALFPRGGGYGFPVRFKIETSKGGAGWSLAYDHTAADLFRANANAPVVIEFPSRKADKVRITVTKQGRDDNGNFLTQLAEIEAYAPAAEIAPAPTAAVQDDVNDTFGFTLVPGYERLDAYEISLDNGQTWQTLAANPVTGLAGYHAAGAIQVRLKGNKDADIPAGRVLANDQPYRTGSPLEPLSPASVSASGEFAGLVKENVINGKKDDFWSTEPFSQAEANSWIAVELDDWYTVSRIDLTPRSGGLGFPSRFRLETSLDGVLWHTAADNTAADYANPGSASISFPIVPVNAKWVRLAAVKQSADNFGNFYTQLSEFEVFKEGGTAAINRKAPTAPVHDDTLNTFGFTPVPGISDIRQYEYSKNGGASWTTVSSNPISGFTGNIAADQIQVRVKAKSSIGRPPGQSLYATQSYTANSFGWQAEYTSSAPDIDGQLADPVWEKALVHVVSQANVVRGEGTWIEVAANPKSPNQGEYRLLWDANRLYLSAKVKDADAHFGASKGEQLNALTDALQVVLDPLNTKRENSVDDAYIIDLVPATLQGVASAYEHWQYNSAVDAIDIKGAVTGDGYTIEAALPWSMFHNGTVDIRKDSKMGFGIIQLDVSAQGATQELLMDFGAGNNEIGNPSRWNSLVLQRHEDEPKQPDPKQPDPGEHGSGSGTSVTTELKPYDVVKTTTAEGMQVQTADVNKDYFLKQLKDEAAESSGREVEIAVKGDEPVQQMRFSGSLLLEGLALAPNAVLTFRTQAGEYKLPLSGLPMESFARKWGVKPENLNFVAAITRVQGEGARRFTEQAKAQGAEILGSVLDFTVHVFAGEQREELTDLGAAYIRRAIIPGSSTALASTDTVVTLDPSTGKLKFVPSVASDSGGSRRMDFVSRSNSLYAIVRSSISFADIQGHWAQKEIERLASKHLIQGVDGAHYMANRTITRAEFVALLVKGIGLRTTAAAQAGTGAVAFTDVGADQWYSGFVAAAVSAGLINGYEDGTFRPQDLITREQMGVMLSKAYRLAGGTPIEAEQSTALASFADGAAVSGWAQTRLAEMVHLGFIKGISNSLLAPRANANRAEAVVILTRLLQHVKFINP